MHGTLNQKIGKEQAHHNHLNEETDDCGNHVGNGGHQPWKIDLAENTRIFRKGTGVGGQAVGKEGPDGVAAQVEQVRRHAVGADAGNFTEDKGLHQTAEQRRQKQPRRAKNGLLVGDNEIAFGEQVDEVPVVPDLFQIQLQPLMFGGNMGVIVCHSLPLPLS